MNSRFGLLVTLVGSPLLSLPLLSQLKTTNWTKTWIDGLYTRVLLFIKGLENNSKTLQQSSSRSSFSPSNSYDIQQVSTNLKKDENLALIAELPLSRLGQKNHYKYCIPANSSLFKTNENTASSSNSTDCKLEWFGSQPNYEKTKKEEISFLLETIAKFIEVQHASNILMFYDPATNFQTNEQTGGGISNKFSSIVKACNLKHSDSKVLIRELFFSPKDCLLSPSSARINLELLHSPNLIKTNSTPEIQVTKEKLLKSKVSGTLRYGIFDYYAKLKKISSVENSDNKPQKHVTLNINWPLAFYLGKENSNNCFLEPIWKQVKARELKFEELKNRCV